MKYRFRKRQNCALPSKSADGKQDYQKHVDVWKDAKFQKSYNFSGNTKFERLLLDLLNIKSDWSY